MSTDKTYLVTFCVHDCYRITLTAASEEEVNRSGFVGGSNS